MRSMNLGDLNTCHPRAALVRRSPARSLHIIPPDLRARSKCVELVEESVPQDADLSRRKPSQGPTCPINALSAQKSSARSMTGRDTKSHYIYHSRDGYVHFTGRVLLSLTVRIFVVCFAEKLRQRMPTSKHITIFRVKIETWMSALSTERTILYSTYVLFTMPSTKLGR